MSTAEKVDALLEWMEAEDAAMESGIHTKHLRILLSLDRNDDIEVGELSKRLGYPPSTVSRLLSQLARYTSKGKIRGNELIEWRVDSLDRRVQRIVLSNKGKEFVKRFKTEIQKL